MTADNTVKTAYEAVADCPDTCHIPLDFSENGEGTFIGNISSVFDEYNKWFEEQCESLEPFWSALNLDKSEAALFVSAFSAVLLKVLEECSLGKRFFAMHLLWAFINKYSALFLEDKSGSEKSGFFQYCSVDSGALPDKLFRMRSSQKKHDIGSRSDIFHIPYNKKHLLKRWRYAVSGVPSLYLSESLWGCWKEIGEPDLESCSVSRFKLTLPENNEYNEKLDNYILNLAFDFRRVSSEKEISCGDNEAHYCDEKAIAYQLLMRPLIMACSVIKEQDESCFNEEYTISNILLELLYQRHDLPANVNRQAGTKGVIGIRHFSTKGSFSSCWELENISYESKFISYAIVASPSADGDRLNLESSLAECCTFSSPVSWQELRAVSPQFMGEKIRANRSDSADGYILSHYEQTEFGRFERELAEFPCKNVKNQE